MPLLERAHALEKFLGKWPDFGEGMNGYAPWETTEPGIFQGICGFPGGAGRGASDPDY